MPRSSRHRYARPLVILCCLVGMFVLSSSWAAHGQSPTGVSDIEFIESTMPFDLGSRLARQHAIPVRQQNSLPVTDQAPVTTSPAQLAATGMGWQKLMSENFEQPINATGDGWIGVDASSADLGLYLWDRRTCRPHSGSYSAWAGGWRQDGPNPACGSTYANNLETYLYRYPVDLSQVTAAQLVFGLWADLEGTFQNQIDTIAWMASLDDETFAGWITSDYTSDWIPRSLDLTSLPPMGDLTGHPEVFIRWDFRSNASNPQPYEGVFIDDITLWGYTEPPPVVLPDIISLPEWHTSVRDFGSGGSDDGTVMITSQGDGALVLAPPVEQLDTWDHLPPLPRELHSVEIEIAQDHLFVIGGNASDDFAQRNVYSTPLRRDGVIGLWQELAPLPQALIGHASVVVGDYLFVLGGANTNGTQSSVFRAQIRPDGTLSPWATLPSLPEPLDNMAAVAANGSIYVLGGELSTVGAVSDTIYRAQVNADGSIGSWQTLPDPLPMPTRYHAAAVACNQLFMIAGVDESRERDGVFVAPIQDDGSLGTWELTHPLPKTLSGHDASAVNGGIVVLGGWESGNPVNGPQSAVYLLPLDATCSPGPWQSLTPMPYGSTYVNMAASNTFVYAIGGINAEGITFNSVLMAPLQTDSQLRVPGRYRNQFKLGEDYMIQALQWTETGTGDTDIQVRYRIAPAAGGEFGPWSNPTSTNPISIMAYGGYVEYEIQFTPGSTADTRAVSDVHLTITSNTPPQLTGLPDQTLVAGISPAPRIDLRTYASDAESTSDRLTFALLHVLPPGVEVHIVDRYYLNISSTGDWTGQTTIAVQVTDPGGLSATDQFMLTVLPNDDDPEDPQQYIFLPLVKR